MGGEEVSEITDEVKDAVGEIANMIAGGAKSALAQKGFTFRIAIPSIVVGKNHEVAHKGSGPCLVVPFHLDEQTFWLEVSFDPAKAG
jgi:chemotaxis protein CheX